MTIASVNDIRKELLNLGTKDVQALCLRLARFKKENKELLSYLLFDVTDEPGYIQSIKDDMEEMFKELTNKNLYLIKKSLRKILRYANRQIKYSSLPQTELEVRIHFCQQILAHNIPLTSGSILFNLYQQQIKKIENVVAKLPEDEQGDYTRSIESIL